MISESPRKEILAQPGLDDWDLQDDALAGQVAARDSLSHARIIAAVEEGYGISFQRPELMRLDHLGQIQALVDRKAS